VLKMNLFQQFGVAAFLGGGILFSWRHWKGVPGAQVAQFHLSGGTVGVTLPPDWVITALLIGGLVMLALGTAWRAVRGDRGGEEEIPEQ
jgi:hypothetical protein